MHYIPLDRLLGSGADVDRRPYVPYRKNIMVMELNLKNIQNNLPTKFDVPYEWKTTLLTRVALFPNGLLFDILVF